jgi:hypothetical protein
LKETLIFRIWSSSSGVRRPRQGGALADTEGVYGKAGFARE